MGGAGFPTRGLRHDVKGVQLNVIKSRKQYISASIELITSFIEASTP